MPVGGLTDEEAQKWCKSIEGYRHLLNKPDKTPKEQAELKRLSEECRDWARYHKIINTKNSYTYNPKVHKSKIFDTLKEAYHG